MVAWVSLTVAPRSTRRRGAIAPRQNDGGKMFLVRVIIDTAFDPAVVVTVYRTTKVQKYWRTP
jgi:hypothetical protein